MEKHMFEFKFSFKIKRFIIDHFNKSICKKYDNHCSDRNKFSTKEQNSTYLSPLVMKIAFQDYYLLLASFSTPTNYVCTFKHITLCLETHSKSNQNGCVDFTTN